MGIPEPIIHTTLIFMAIVAAFCVMQLFLRCLGARPPASRGRRAPHQHTSRRSAARTTRASHWSSTRSRASAAGSSGSARGCTSGTPYSVQFMKEKVVASRRRPASARTWCPPKSSVIYTASRRPRGAGEAPRTACAARRGARLYSGAQLLRSETRRGRAVGPVRRLFRRRRLLNELSYVYFYFGCSRTLTPSLSTILTLNSGMWTKNRI